MIPDSHQQPSAGQPQKLSELQLDQLLKRQSQSWRIGTPQSVESLLSDVGLADYESFDIDQLLTLICGEVLLRDASGERPVLAEYQQRFPLRTEELGIQWEIDRLLAFQSIDVSEHAIKETACDRAPAPVRECPKSIGRYEIFSELGRGSKGVVYEAWDPKLKRRVAVKRLRSGMDATDDDLHRMRNEAEVIAMIRHPNIVQIFDVDDVDGLPFLATEFCEGGSLAQRLEGIPLPPKLAAELVWQISNGVAAAHACRIIHRDLKPANVLLEQPHQWNPKVTDFGLAKQLDSETMDTATGSILGTPAYMSPEQAAGDVARIGVMSDVYSIGAILYECLTGRPPFQGVTIGDTLDQVRQREPVRVRQLAPDTPLDIETITHKCLRKDPAQRYQSVQDLADDLRCFLDQRPIQARRERPWEAAIRIGRKHRLASGLAITSLLLLLTIAIGSLIFAGRLSTALEKSQQYARTASLEQANALVGSAHGMRSSRQPGQRLDALASIMKAQEIGKSLNHPAEWFENLRDEAIAAMLLPDACVQEFREEDATVQYSDFSDDHRLYAFSFDVGDTSLRRMSDHVEIARIPRLDKSVGLLFVGSDQLIQFGIPSGKFEKWNVGVSPPQRVWRRDSGFESMALAPDHQTIAVTDSKVIQIVDLASGEVISRRDSKPFFRACRLTMHPTHPYVCLYSYYKPAIEIRNWMTGELLTRFEPTDLLDNNFSGANWSPDGKQFVLLSGHGGAVRWFTFDPVTATLTLEKTKSPAGFSQGGLRFNANGDRLWHNGWGQSVEIIDAIQSKLLIQSFRLGGTFIDGFPKLDPLGTYAGFYYLPDHPKRVGLMRVADQNDSNLLVPVIDGLSGAGFDPAERFVVVRMKNRLQFIRPDNRRVLLDLHIAELDIYSFFVAEDQLIVNAFEGCFQWPFQYVAQNNSIELGLPRRIAIPSGDGFVSASRDGRTIAGGFWNGGRTQEYAGIWIKTACEPAARKVVGRESGRKTSVSRDGRWIVGAHDSGTSVFDGMNPELTILQLKPQTNIWGNSCFSDDGARLVAGGKLINTANWETNSGVGEGTAEQLSRDGNYLLSYLQSHIESHVDVLSNTVTGKVFARVPAGLLGESVLSPNANYLVTKYRDGIHLTDLRAIRDGVVELGFAWDGPDYEQHVRPTPLDSVSLVPEMQGINSAAKLFQLMDSTTLQRSAESPHDGQLQFDAAMVYLARQNLEDAIQHLNRACEILPHSITARQWRAYLLAESGRWSEAVVDADWVVQQIDEPDFRLLRAEWLIRTGDFDRAIEDCAHLINIKSTLKMDAHGLRSYCYKSIGDSEAAQADQQVFQEKLGHDEQMFNMVAYPMVGPDLSLRHPVIAQLVIDRLLAIQSKFPPETRDTVTMTFYRNERYRECLDALKENLVDKANFCYPYALVTAAMCQAKLGDLEAAKDYLQQAKSWDGDFSSFNERRDFEMLIAEAARIMRGLSQTE